jgi:hypothetical protein
VAPALPPLAAPHAARPLPPLAPALAADLNAFSSELAARLRPFGVALAWAAPPGKPVFSRERCAPASSVPAAAKTPAKLNDLRDKLRVLQDKTHQREEVMLRQLCALGYPELVTAAVQASSTGCKDVIVASYALQSVGNLAMEDGNRQRLADLGCVELVVEAMRAHIGLGGGGGGASAMPASASQGGRVLKDAIVALRHLAYENDASKKRVMDAGGVEAVVAAMNVFADNSHVQRQACSAVVVFAVHSSLGDAARARVLACGGLTAIIAALKRFGDDTQLLPQGIKALVSLVSYGDARAAARDAGLADLVEAIAKREGVALGPAVVGGGELAESLRAIMRKLAPVMAEAKK